MKRFQLLIIPFLLLVIIPLLLLSCDKNPVKESRDWDKYVGIFPSKDEPQQTTYYKPYAGYCGDVMPYFDSISQEFRIYYLQDFRPNPEGTYHPIWAVSSKDGASYVSMGESVGCGSLYEQDAALGTGSVIYSKEEQLYYLYYTGERYMEYASKGDVFQAMMRATSKDGKTWVKDPEFIMRGRDFGYDTNDFRDACLRKDEMGYHMYVSTRKNGKGVIAEFVSENLKDWRDNGVFMTMLWDRFYECCDIFQLGEYWYLVYSDQVYSRRVQYFKGRTLEELRATTRDEGNPQWPDGHEGILDSRGQYAGRTAFDGTNRYLWAWCPTRSGANNLATGNPDWGGNMVCHRLYQHADGTLTLAAVDAIAQKYTQSLRPDQRLLYHNHIHAKVTTETANDNFGIALVYDSTAAYYTMKLNAESETKRKINFEHEGIGGSGFVGLIDGYVFDTPEDNTYVIDVFTDNSVVTMYISSSEGTPIANYTNRIYGIAHNKWQVVTYGNQNIKVEDVVVTAY